jgi:hypothetical protein
MSSSPSSLLDAVSGVKRECVLTEVTSLAAAAAVDDIVMCC